MVIAFDDFENSKENIQPLRQGRKPDVLQKLCKAPQKAKQESEDRRREFEALLEHSLPEEILGNWERYLAWARQHYPMGGHQSHLIDLYERATQQLNDGTHRDDYRYVQLWLDYAGLVRNPLDIYRYMDHNSIGHRDAQFYVAWAVYMELCGRYAEAEEIYRTARERGAQPSNLLHSHYTDYAMGNVRRMKEQFETLNCGTRDSFNDENFPNRAPFGALHHPAVSRHHAPSPVNQLFRPLSEISLKANQSANKRRAIPIYEDTIPPAVGTFSWPSLAPERLRKKENIPPNLKWANTTVPSSTAMPSRMRKLEIYADEGEAD